LEVVERRAHILTISDSKKNKKKYFERKEQGFDFIRKVREMK